MVQSLNVHLMENTIKKMKKLIIETHVCLWPTQKANRSQQRNPGWTAKCCKLHYFPGIFCAFLGLGFGLDFFFFFFLPYFGVLCLGFGVFFQPLQSWYLHAWGTRKLDPAKAFSALWSINDQLTVKADYFNLLSQQLSLFLSSGDYTSQKSNRLFETPPKP